MADNKILTKKFERDFSKPSCLDYCYIDPAFCPLCNRKQDDGSIVGVKIELERWTDKENGTVYTVDTKLKKQPYQQGEGGTKPVTEEITDYAEKIAFEKAHTPFCCWSDGSGFEYDIVPENVIGPLGPTDSTYDITNFGIEHKSLELSKWNTWAEKYQKDYRFAQVSDLNATTNLFPNVDDPWMFTEYVFKGTTEGEVVVEPPLYEENTLQLKNADIVFDEEEFNDKELSEKYDSYHCYNDVVTNIITNEEETVYRAKQFRKIVNWDVFNRDETKRELSEFPMNDAGIRLYKIGVNVESIKWGEHGNIPPHTLNMSAPANWFESRQVGKIKPKYIAHIGTPFYANSYGILYWYEDEAYVDGEGASSLVRTGNTYDYVVKSVGANGVKQNMPSTLRDTTTGLLRNTVSLQSRDKNTGDFLHGGCSFLEGTGGSCRCNALDAATGTDRDYLSDQFDNFSQCIGASGGSYPCTRRVQGIDYPLLATYEGTAADKSAYLEQMFGVYSGEGADERAWSDGVMSGSVGLPSADMFAAQGMYASPKRGRDDIKSDTSVSVWYETSFEFVYKDANSVRLDNSTTGAFARGATITRGSGKMAINTESNSSPLSDGEADSFAFGDLDQISFHRWFNNVMHCQNCAYCNDTYGVLEMQQGFDPAKKAGGDGACRYYRNGKNGSDCPTDGVPKRAYEFQMTMGIASGYFASLKSWWINLTEEARLDYNARFVYRKEVDSVVEGVTTYKNDPVNEYFLKPVFVGTHSDLTVSGSNSSDILDNFDVELGYTAGKNVAYIVYCKTDATSVLGGAKVYSGQKIVVAKEIVDYIKTLDDYDVDVFDETISPDGSCELNGSFYKIGMIRFDGEGFFWYDAITDSGQAWDTWLVRVDTSFPQARYNSVIIDNEEKFIGGFHPQYKDYTEMGEEFMMDVVSDSYRDAMGDIIGDYDHDGIAQPINKKGYWVDYSGKYIVDEKTFDIDKPLASDSDRKEFLNGPGVTISFKKSNTSINIEDGEKTSPRTINCAVQPNDSYTLIHNYKYDKGDTPPVYNNGLTGGIKGWHYPDARPIYQDDQGNDYWAPPYIADMFSLPTMRMVAYCSECDYYLSYRYHDLLCPWCGNRLKTVPGDRGESVLDGVAWTDVYSEDENDENYVELFPVMKKFFKVKAIGKVQVWAPPGTCIRKDAYFWKNPTVVNNSLKTQIKHRLGSNVNGVWRFDKMGSNSEFTLGLPEQIGTFKPMPEFISAEADEGKFYANVNWTGVTMEDRETYASFNDIMPKVMIPGFGSLNPTNENLIIPYTRNSNDGLKMVTIDEIRNLRNHLQPVLGYVSDLVEQNDFDTKRASYENREDITYPRFYYKRKCKALPVVQAVAENMGDSYVQFWSGDKDYGSVREYYPAGHSWWKLNNVIGGKYDDQTGGFYHFSGNNPWGGGKWVHSKAAIFIHGMLPLDKEILKAYIIIQPAGEPYKEPIGRGWNGVIHYSHYHPFTELHHGKGAGRHLHGQAGFLGNFDEEGNYTQADGGSVRLLDESDYTGWGSEGEKFDILEDYISTIDDKFSSCVTGLSGVFDNSFWHQNGVNVAGVANTGLIYYNLLASTKENIKFKYVRVDQGELKVQYSFSEIWRNKTSGEMADLVNRHLVGATIKVSDGTIENTVSHSFNQWSSKMLNDIIPENTQNIPGYFNYSGFNSAKVYGAYFKVGSSVPEYFDGPVIVQSETSVPDSYRGGGGEFGGGGASGSWGQRESAGIIPRVVEVTGIVQKLYNDRISRSFICNGGKSLSELFDTVYPTVLGDDFFPDGIEWNGVGEPLEEDVASAAVWNAQIRDAAFEGYLLNDVNTYPKLDENNIPVGSETGGDRYELSPSRIEFYIDCLTPFSIGETNKYYRIDANPESEFFGEKKELSYTGIVLDIDKVIELLEEMFGEDFEITKEGSLKCKISQTGDSLLESINLVGIANNCYNVFGLNSGVILGVQNRCISVSSHSSGHHPSTLGVGGDWLFSNFNDMQPYFVMDLARAPLEYSESNYRFKPPQVDCTACTCPVDGCICYDVPTGLWAKSMGKTMVVGSTDCPACGADLTSQTGAVSNAGDGLYTYSYDTPFYQDCFVTGFHIVPKEKCNYRVSIRGYNENGWLVLANVTYDNVLNKYKKFSCFGESGEGLIVEQSDNAFTKFVLPASKYRRARYVLVECDGYKQDLDLSYLVVSDVDPSNRYRLVVSGNFSNMGLYNFSGKLVNGLKVSDGATETVSLPIVTTEVNADFDRMTIYFGVELYNLASDEITLSTSKWTGGIDEFDIYGSHYKETELKITDREELLQFFMNSSTLSFNLPEYPTQFLSVSCGKNGFGGIELKEVESKDDLSWETEEYDVYPSEGEKVTIKRIIGGNYFFDYIYNKIYIPEKNQENILFNNFESALIGEAYSGSFLPTILSVRYWSGNGYEIDLEAVANEEGPSYQLEKETITIIENISILPDNGISTRMQGYGEESASRKAIPWYCYNKEACTLPEVTQSITGGYWKSPKIAFNALSSDSDKFFEDLFGENNIRLGGRAKTIVTFVGAPNQIVSGRIMVKAPAITVKKLNIGSETIVTQERTGGLKNGCIIVSVPVDPCNGRKTLAFDIPKLVIYAKERDPKEPIIM